MGAFCWLMMVNAAIVSGAAPLSETSEPRALAGTFLQLWHSHNDWSAVRWTRLFEDFRQLGLRQVIVQWTAIDGERFYGQSGVLEAVLQEADRQRMTVVLGLPQDSDYWERIAGPAESASEYLSDVRTRSLRVAAELGEVAARHPSAAGWYIPGEVDEVTWHDTTRRQILAKHLRLLSGALHQLHPAWPVMISTFTDRRTGVKNFEEFWTGLLRQAPIDLVYLQDGVGVHKLRVPEVDGYWQALRRAATAEGRRAGLIVELLEQIAGTPLDDGRFEAVPAPLWRIVAQLGVAAGLRSEEPVMGFSVPEYMTPTSGQDAAETLFLSYRDWLKGPALFCPAKSTIFGPPPTEAF